MRLGKFTDEEEKRRQRAEKHGCDGRCYTSVYMCPAAETCPETQRGEFAATLGALAFLTAVPLAGLCLAIYFLRLLF